MSGRVRLDALARYLQDVAADDVDDAGVEGAWVMRRMAFRAGMSGQSVGLLLDAAVRYERLDPRPARESYLEALSAALHRSDNPVMLIRLRPNQNVVKRAGQENFNFGDYYAYSKICTHLGCPTSLYEQQTGRLLCPCHQSQFDVFEYAKPVFGPAARALPQLPIEVDESGYFVARGDFIEPIGPAFWERDS